MVEQEEFSSLCLIGLEQNVIDVIEQHSVVCDTLCCSASDYIFGWPAVKNQVKQKC
jgi:hypothetical protein